MTYREERMDLFSVPTDEYMLCHCISGDFVLGAGIAKEFRNRGVRDALKEQYSSAERSFGKDFKGHCYIVEVSGMTVANLVTKPYYDDKPTEFTLVWALMDMRKQMKDSGIKKIAMPRIGCGLDRLKWDRVSEYIKYAFEDDDVDILVCTL